MSIVKRQHYVWRQYLRAWSSKEQICALLKDKKEVMTISLMGVAQERYFYRLQELSISEFEFLEELISKKSHPSVQGLLNDFLMPYRAFTDISQKIKIQPNEKFESELREIEINTLEKIHEKFEKNGTKLISCNSIEGLKKLLSNPDDRNSALIFLCIQYYRTQKIKIDVINSFNEDGRIDVSKIWNIISLIMSFNTARNIAVNEKLKFRWFKNQSSIPFVTGDQPVLNIKQNDKDEFGNVKGLEFFYPLSPNNAISVHFENAQIEQVEEILISQSMVEYFNDFIIDNSSKFSFGNNEEYLNKKK
jgi:hypothetical protein